MSEGSFDRARVRRLAQALGGEVVQPGDDRYDEQRAVWNGSIDRRPDLIARCANRDDVAAAVRLGREAEATVAVRGGGHSFPGLSVCDGGMVIDLSPMKGIEVDPERSTVRAQAGVLLGELDAATQPHGLAVPAGIVTHTGLAGLTLGGGIGWLHRKYGMTIDQLLAVEMITADGEPVRADAEENAELFWGLRGGGGNFGVVTEFEFRLNPAGPTVYAGPVFWSLEDAEGVLRHYRDWIASAPDELMTIVVVRRAPAVDFVPAELHGRLVIVVVCFYSGDLDQGERVIEPMRKFREPLLDLCEPKPYLEHQAMFDPTFPHGRHYYFRACDVAELNDDVIDTTIRFAEQIRSPLTTFPIWQLGGALGRVGDDETAFSGRGAGHAFNITGITETAEGFDAERQWARDFWDALSPHHRGVYVNFLMDEGTERIRQAYSPAKFERLQALKAAWDPANFFHHNQNIPPAD